MQPYPQTSLCDSSAFERRVATIDGKRFKVILALDVVGVAGRDYARSCDIKGGKLNFMYKIGVAVSQQPMQNEFSMFVARKVLSAYIKCIHDGRCCVSELIMRECD